MHGLVGNFAWLEELYFPLWRGLSDQSCSWLLMHCKAIKCTSRHLFVTATASDSLARSPHHLTSVLLVVVAAAAVAQRKQHSPPWLYVCGLSRKEKIEEAGGQAPAIDRCTCGCCALVRCLCVARNVMCNPAT